MFSGVTVEIDQYYITKSIRMKRAILVLFLLYDLINEAKFESLVFITKATCKYRDEPAQKGSLIRAFAARTHHLLV